MNSRFKGINIKSFTCYFFDGMINIKKLKQNQGRRKFIQKYYYLLHWIHDNQRPQLYKVNNVNPLYLIIDKINGYIEESNGNKYLTLVHTDKIKDTLKMYEELWNKIRDLIISTTNLRQL